MHNGKNISHVLKKLTGYFYGGKDKTIEWYLAVNFLYSRLYEMIDSNLQFYERHCDKLMSHYDYLSTDLLKSFTDDQLSCICRSYKIKDNFRKTKEDFFNSFQKVFLVGSGKCDDDVYVKEIYISYMYKTSLMLAIIHDEMGGLSKSCFNRSMDRIADLVPDDECNEEVLGSDGILKRLLNIADMVEEYIQIE